MQWIVQCQTAAGQLKSVLAVNTLQPLSAVVAANEDAKPAW